MFYFIECDKDQSLCTVEDFEVVCDPDQPPMLDENVEFFYGKEMYKGVFVGMSGKLMISLKFRFIFPI